MNQIAELPKLQTEITNAIRPDDYAAIRDSIAYITDEWRDQPSLDTIASAVGADPARLQKVFRRWAGITPKQFIQAITIDHARTLLAGSTSILDTAFEVGLSGPGRLHDLFVTHEAMSPGEYRTGGQGLTIEWGFHSSPFGDALIMITERGLAGLAFADSEDGHPAALTDMQNRWPNATYQQNDQATQAYAQRIFDPARWNPQEPLRVVLIGTDFQVRVWETLLRIPLGAATTYGDVADRIGKPTAARAVGAAVGRNPISFVVPCHRVLGSSGSLTGYHWGLTRKRAILGWESVMSSDN